MSNPKYFYTYVQHSDEHELCQLEMRSFFGYDSSSNVLISTVGIDPSRSPFMKERLEVLYETNSWEDLVEEVKKLDVNGSTFKVVCLNTMDLAPTKKIGHPVRRQLEREMGLCINGDPDLFHPDRTFGFVEFDGNWYFGRYEESESVWYQHQKKPHSYSTSLNTRVARAVANIAAPNPRGVKVIDPCCGIGTVLVEALSMGIDIVGRDINPLVIEPVKENFAYFGLVGDVEAGPISDIVDIYDVAIIDMPYNIFSKTTPEAQLEILKHGRRIAKKVVIVSIDTIDPITEKLGLTIVDRCVAKKGLFVRQVLVCE